MDRSIKTDVAALVAFLSLGSGAACLAQDAAQASKSPANPLLAKENTAPKGKGTDSACGVGSCGTDKKGADAAKKAHKKSSAKKSATKAKSSEKAEGHSTSQEKSK